MICPNCDREDKCQYPCTDYEKNQNLKNSNPCKSRVTEDVIPHKSVFSSERENDISKYLNYDVEDPEWLKAMTDIDFMQYEMIDNLSIYKYLEEKNEEYCAKNGLCEYCRSKFIEIKEPMGEQFGTPVYIDALVCPKCG